MIDLPINDLLPLIGLYAETHYRFPFLPFSRYYRREPEIIFDAPYRLQPGLPLPVTLIVKDANLYPIELQEVILTANDIDGQKTSTRFLINRLMECTFWYDIYDLDLKNLSPGIVSVDCQLIFKNRGRLKAVRNDNHAGLSHAPLKVYRAEEPLPVFPGWQAGELHCHTSYGPDYVEFGAPLEAIQRTAEAIGLGWTALTDHSYNLDDLPDNYLKQDPELTKWKLLHEEAERLSNGNSVILIPGEEVTVRNHKDRNVHLIILGNREFLYGSGDGAEKWLKTKSELSIPQALEIISEQALAFAAHPLVPTPPLEWLLVRRGDWSAEDLAHPRLDGWQIANGGWGIDFVRGFEIWVSNLCKGKIIPVFAGNDAHGNFNRFRQVRLPMINLWEHDRNLFGKLRTLVKTDSRNAAGIIDGLKKNSVVLSDGPALKIEQEGGVAVVHWKTSVEFGEIQSITLIEGLGGEERPLPLDIPASSICSSSGEYPFQSNGLYVRAEIVTLTKTGQRFRAITNAKIQQNFQAQK